MKRTFTRDRLCHFPFSCAASCLVALLLITMHVGCGTKEVGESEFDSTEPDIVQNDSDLPQVASDDPVEELRQLTLMARKMEAEENYIAAINVWTDIVSKLQAEFGADAWQTKNAVLALETSKQQQGFDPSQRATLAAITKLQKQIRAASEQNQVGSATVGAKEIVEKTSVLFGPDSAVTAKQRRLYGQLLNRMGEVEKSIWQYEKSANDLQEYFQAGHPEVCNVHDELGQIYLDSNQHRGAVQHLSVAASLAREIWGEFSVQYAKRANQLGVALYRDGNLKEALTVLQAAEVIRKKAKGENSVEVAHSQHNIGTVMMELRLLPNAIEKLKSAYDIFRAGKLVSLELQVGGKLATTYMLNKQPDEAEIFLAREVEYLEAAGNEGPELADAKYRLAISMGRQGDYGRAEPVIKAALESNESHFGPYHSRTINCYQAYAKMLELLNRLAEANGLLNQLRVAQAGTDSKTFSNTLR